VRELSKGWSFTNLNNIATENGILSDGDWVESKDQDPSGGIRLLQLADIGDGIFLDKSNRFINEDKFKALRCTEIFEGDLLIARMPDPLGRVCQLPKLKERCITVVDVAIFRSCKELISLLWLKHFLNSPDIRQEINLLSSGTTRKRIARKKLGEIEIPLPPLNEQKRIADRLDQLLTRIDKTKAHLDRIPPLLKRFRQSVLAAATSGKLTEEWREDNGEAREIICEPLSKLIDLDLGFAFKSSEFLDEGIRLLRGDNIEPGKLRWKDAKYFDPIKLQSFSHLMLKEGDLVLAMDRPIISSGLKISRVSKDDIPSVLVQRVCRFKPTSDSDLNLDYLHIFLSSNNFVKYLLNKQNGTQIPHISGKQILEFSIVISPIEEQQEIVRRVEALFAKADRIEAQYKNARQQVDRLTPALLAKAFRGELVPQDANDEPASVLLERVKEARSIGQIKTVQRTKKKIKF